MHTVQTVKNELALTLLQDPVHEYRLTALFMMVYRYERSGSETEKAALIQCYLDHLSWVNNWDLVDSSAYQLLGPYLEHRDRAVELAFLDRHSHRMNRTALRYAIEKFEPELRAHYLAQRTGQGERREHHRRS